MLRDTTIHGIFGRQGFARAIQLVAGAVVFSAAVCPGVSAEIVSPWIEGLKSKTRLVAGAGPDGKIVAGVEVIMPKGWKTYWRTPGEAGGIPPSFDWSRTSNARDVKVLYPAPSRLTDKSGDIIGYQDAVTFPIQMMPEDPSKPVHLALTIQYGVCKEICVPVEGDIELDVTAAEAGDLPEDLASALARVPKASGPGPKLSNVDIDLAKVPGRVSFDVTDSGEGADAFAEAPDGIYVPQPKAQPGQAGATRYVIELLGQSDIAALKGKPLTITLIGSSGQTEASINLP